MENSNRIRVWLIEFEKYVTPLAVYYFEDKLAIKYYQDNQICLDSDKFFIIEKCSGKCDKNGTLIFEGIK